MERKNDINYICNDPGPSSRRNAPSFSRRVNICQYAERCYRRNVAHFMEYSHPHLDRLIAELGNEPLKLDSISTCPGVPKDLISAQIEIVRKQSKALRLTQQAAKEIGNQCRNAQEATKKGQDASTTNLTAKKPSMAERHAAAAPFFLFLARVTACERTYNDPKSMAFHDLLDQSLGKLDSSIHLNFMVEGDFLLQQYKIHNVESKPLMVIYGHLDMPRERTPVNVTAIHIKPVQLFGQHHTKLAMFFYKDKSLRVAVFTANLVETDWDNRTQGIWLSPACQQLPEGSDTLQGESPTGFKADLMLYLQVYTTHIKSVHYLNAYKVWLDRVGMTDFSRINVCFVASVPNSHRGRERRNWGHLKLGKMLALHAQVPYHEEWPVVAQCSSIGSLGSTPKQWTCSEFLGSMSVTTNSANAVHAMDLDPMAIPPILTPKVKLAPFKLIYPSLIDVGLGYDGLAGGSCLPYLKKNHDKQEWLEQFLCRWQANHTFRTRAMPHIKTYTRFSEDGSKMSWFLLTSANMSKAAWGTVLKDKRGINIQSFEAGVLFLPKFILGESFPEFDIPGKHGTPVPYDWPLTPYEQGEDAPWFFDVLRSLPQ